MTGRARKGLVMLVAIGGLFITGLALTAFTCVNPDEYGLEFVAQIFAGGPTLAALFTTKGLTVTEFMPHFDVGRLYVDVAGLLNVVAVSDALGLAMLSASFSVMAWSSTSASAPPSSSGCS